MNASSRARARDRANRKRERLLQAFLDGEIAAASEGLVRRGERLHVLTPAEASALLEVLYEKVQQGEQAEVVNEQRVEREVARTAFISRLFYLMVAVASMLAIVALCLALGTGDGLELLARLVTVGTVVYALILGVKGVLKRMIERFTRH